MKIGLFTPVYGSLSTSEMLEKVKALPQVGALELGTGGWPDRPTSMWTLSRIPAGHATTARC
jgi:hypothetical protein